MSLKNLILVDDDEDTCSNLTDILSDLGYSVDVAYRGGDGLDLVKERPYQLALLDYKLPCMTGVELFTRMRQIRGKIEGLLITAFVSNQTADEAIAAGMRHVVHKPVEVPQLTALIEKTLT